MNQKLYGVVLFSCATASACLGQVIPQIVEFEVASTSRVEVRLPTEPVEDSDSAVASGGVNPEADTEAEAEASDGTDVYCVVESSGFAPGSTTIFLDAEIYFEVDRPFPSSAPVERLAAGSWSHRVVFEIDRSASADLRVICGELRDVGFSTLEPGKLTGPSGVIVSGRPSLGVTSWTWELELEPGQYTLESFGSFEFLTDEDRDFDDGLLKLSRLSFLESRCAADLDGDGELTLFDFLMFQNLFDAGDPQADFDDDGELTIFDFLAFQNAFDTGCA